MPSREDDVVAAALELVALRGVRALTHRAVDEQARLPQGSASNVFRSRHALVAGVLRHILVMERSRIAELPAVHSREELLTNAQLMVDYLLGPGVMLTRARYAIFLEALQYEELRAEIADATDTLLQAVAATIEPITEDTDDERRVRAGMILSALDACLLGTLVRPASVVRTQTAVRALVGGAMDAAL